MRDKKSKGWKRAFLGRKRITRSQTEQRGGALLSVVTLAILGIYGATVSATTVPLAPLPDVKMPSAAKVKLGKMLFFEKRLSGDADRACSDCHIPEDNWVSRDQMSIGYPGTLHYRNVKTVVNSRFAEYFYWDGRLDGGGDMGTQVRDTLTAPHFMSSDGRILGQRLKQVPEYVKMFKDAYNGEPYFGLILKAVSDFEKTLISRNVPLDKYLKGDKNALSAKAKQGLALFEGKAGCIQCHDGMLLTDSKPHATGVPVNPDLFLTERYTTLRSDQVFLGTPNYWNLKQDPGHFAVEKNQKYFGTFVTPSLREVSKTAPYMHNGMLPTLSAVVDFYNDGGGEAKNKDEKIKPLGLNTSEKAALVAFLESLAGDSQGISSADFSEEKRPKYKLLKWVGKKN